MLREKFSGIRRVLICGSVLLGLVLGFAGAGSASELGHYAPALMNIRDSIQPAPGTYYIQYHLYYRSNTYKDRNGDKVNSIMVGPLTITLNVDVDSFTIVPTFVHVTELKVLGANYGFLVAQPFGNTSFQATLEAQTMPGFGAGVDKSGFGIGDTYVRPLWFGWNLGQVDINVAYGVYVPIGKYSAGGLDNVGLGMWTHEFMVSGAFYVGEFRSTAFTMAGVYEIHHSKKDVDIRPGSHFTLSSGLSQYLPLGDKLLAELGVAGFGQWQITEDKGSAAVNTTVKDQVYALGLQAGLIYIPWDGQLTFKWMHEFKAKDRFEGDFFTLTAALTF